MVVRTYILIYLTNRPPEKNIQIYTLNVGHKNIKKSKNELENLKHENPSLFSTIYFDVLCNQQGLTLNWIRSKAIWTRFSH